MPSTAIPTTEMKNINAQIGAGFGKKSVDKFYVKFKRKTEKKCNFRLTNQMKHSN